MLEELEKNAENDSDVASAKASQSGSEANTRGAHRRVRTFGSTRKPMGGDALLGQVRLGLEK